MSIKYYIDNNGSYKGGFDGDTGIDISEWTEIEAPPPVHATQTWTGIEWTEYLGE